jgi:hypothetical protein
MVESAACAESVCDLGLLIKNQAASVKNGFVRLLKKQVGGSRHRRRRCLGGSSLENK